MSEQNPYTVLNVPQDASSDEIEDAYDALFDAYEPEARAGDAAAIELLHSLNAAHEILLDPQSRAEVDAALRQPAQKGTVQAQPTLAPTGTATKPVGAKPNTPEPNTNTMGADTRRASTTRPARGNKPGANTAPRRGSTPIGQAAGATVRVRPRASNASRAVQPAPNTRRATLLIAGTLLLVLLGAVAVFLLLRPKDTAGLAAPLPPDPNRGEVLAAVNGVPIYHDDWQVRLDKDKSGALSDPLFAPFINNFQGITGTRMLDILGYDAMDKLINLEMIQQQAKKEGLYPTQKQQEGLISDAKKQDLKNGQTFEQFLQDKKITEDRYNRTVIENVVYTVVANEHLPKSGTADARTNGFVKWICDTRKGYDVKIYRKFTVAENQPCTSGLPSDLPLPGLPADQQGTAVPGEIATSVVPVSPKATP